MTNIYSSDVDSYNAETYILANYDRFFDLTKEREMELRFLLESANASMMTVGELKVQLGVEDNRYLSLLKELVRRYSLQFNQNKEQTIGKRRAS